MVGELIARHGVEPVLHFGTAERVEWLVVPGPATDGLLAEVGRRARVDGDLALVALVGRADDGVISRALGALADAGAPALEAFVGRERASQVFLVDAGLEVLHTLNDHGVSTRAEVTVPQGARVP